MAGQEVSAGTEVDVSRVGESTVLTVDGWTLMMSRADAATIGMALVKVSTLGADTLDLERPGG